MQSTPTAVGLERIDGELGRLNREKTDLLSTVGDDTDVTMSDIRAQLRAVKLKVDELTAERETIEAESAHAQMAAAARSPLLTAPARISFESVPPYLEQIAQRFDALDLDTRRVLIDDLLEVTVRPVHGNRRIDVWHKVAVGLNEDADEREPSDDEIAGAAARAAERENTAPQPPQPAPEGHG